MMRSNSIALALTVVCGFALSSYAQLTDTIIVNDTWADVNRTSSGPDGGGIDSAWWASTTAQNTVPAAGDMRWVIPAGSLFNTTYFPAATTPFAPAAVTLANPGDTLAVTWTFALTGVNATNGNQNFLVGVALTPGAHLAANSSPASEAYTGYATFMNMGQTLGNSSPFALKEWINGATATSLLGASAAWGANGIAGNLGVTGTAGNTGFENTTYTYFMSLTLGLSGDLIITNSITGGTLLNGGAGNETVVVDDTSPNSLTFDTFGVREGTSTATAGQFDTSLFRVDFFTSSVPEPATFTLAGLGMLGLVLARRMRR
jgi:hypothetical protein